MIPIITDTHFGVRNDSPAFKGYYKKYFDEVFFPYLHENNVKKIIHLGDLWDRRKYVNFETLNFFRIHFFERLEEMGVHMTVTLGNHDTALKNTSRVNSVTELCQRYKNVTILDRATEVYFGGIPVLLIPWINDDNYEESLKSIQLTNAKIAMGHLELKGYLMQRGMKSEVGMSADIFSKFDAVYSGHFHHKSTEKNISYLGALFENTFADVNDPRGFHEWFPETNELNYIQNPYKMFHKIYYDDVDKTLNGLLKKVTDKYAGTYVKVIVQNRTNPEYFDKFTDKLFQTNPADVRIEEDLTLNEGDEEMVVDTAEDTLMILNKYVDSLEIESDKDKIKEELRVLYIEATNMEK